MAKINLERLEKLAQIRLEDDEREAILKDLEEIITYFENLKEVQTDNVLPLVYMEEAKLYLREDVVNTGLSVEDLEKIRELYGDGFFKVRKIIGE